MRLETTLRGVDDVERLLGQVSPRVAFNLMRATINGVAGEIRKDAKRYAPRDHGNLQRAIRSKRERAVMGYLWASVRVDPSAFYWRFLEYGQGPDMTEHAFFLKAVENFRADMDRTFVEQFGKKWEAALKRASKTV